MAGSTCAWHLGGISSFVKIFVYSGKKLFSFVKNDKIRFLMQKNIDTWQKMWYDNKVKSAVLWVTTKQSL